MSDKTMTPQELRDEFECLYVKPEIGVVKVDLFEATDKPAALSVWVSDWAAMQRVPHVNDYKGLGIIWGFYIPENTVLAPGFISGDGPGPAALPRRQSATVPTESSNEKDAG